MAAEYQYSKNNPHWINIVTSPNFLAWKLCGVSSEFWVVCLKIQEFSIEDLAFWCMFSM